MGLRAPLASCVVLRTTIRAHADVRPRERGDHQSMTEITATALDELTVADAMHAGVLTCTEDATLETVARMMAAYRIHCVVMLESPEEEAPWGVISDLDLVSAAFDHDADDWTAGEAAGSPAVTIAADEPVRRAAQLMREYGITHLVAVDPESQTPLGVISTLDLARVIAEARES